VKGEPQRRLPEVIREPPVDARRNLNTPTPRGEVAEDTVTDAGTGQWGGGDKNEKKTEKPGSGKRANSE